MSVDSIRFKLNKYENKFKNENNAYKRALYAEKIGGYRNMMKGGTFEGVIEAGVTALDKDFNTFNRELEGKIAAARQGNTNSEQITQQIRGATERITQIKGNITDASQKIRDYVNDINSMKRAMMSSAIKFTDYNIKVRAILRQIIYKLNDIPAVALNDNVLEPLNEIINIGSNIPKVEGLENLPLVKYMGFNSALLGLIGAFLGNDKSDGKRIVGQIRLLLETKYDERVDVSYGDERDADNGQYTDNIPTNWENWANMDANKHKVIYNEVIDKLIDVSTAVTRAPAAVARVPATASAADAAPAAKPKIPVNGDINAEIASVIKNTPNKLYNFNQIRKMIYLFCNVTDAGKKPNIETDSQYEELKTDIRGPTESSEA
jgi:hypothetical protein